jgi:hypothetical protein
MAERLKAHAWKACVRASVPWVRIPLSPPDPNNPRISITCRFSRLPFCPHFAPVHRRRWIMRLLVVPADVRSVIGQSVFKISAGETAEHRVVSEAGAIIGGRRNASGWHAPRCASSLRRRLRTWLPPTRRGRRLSCPR